jgi:hypothetical protein
LEDEGHLQFRKAIIRFIRLMRTSCNIMIR